MKACGGAQLGARVSKRNRPSVLKREREQRKRQRQAKKAAKAAVKRARREGDGGLTSRSMAMDDLESRTVPGDSQLETNAQASRDRC